MSENYPTTEEQILEELRGRDETSELVEVLEKTNTILEQILERIEKLLVKKDA